MPQLPSQSTRNFLGKLQKPAADTLAYRVELAPWLLSLAQPLSPLPPSAPIAPDTLTAATVSVLQTIGSVSITAQSFNGSTLHFQASGGTTGEVCQMTADVQTSNGNSGFFSFTFEIL